MAKPECSPIIRFLAVASRLSLLVKTIQTMFTKFFFKRLHPGKQMEVLQKKGTLIGSRLRNSAMISIYMLSDFFVEVVFQGTSEATAPEHVSIFTSLNRLSDYLEEDAKSGLG